jgi:hypothetical protein
MRLQTLSRNLLGLFLLVASAAVSASQAPAPLADFEGLYDYRDGGTLFIVARGDRLFAVIGESKYALRPAGADKFTNGSGDTIPFTRDGAGRIIAFGESGETFRRRSADVPATVRALFDPRPKGREGTGLGAPPRLADGIRTGEAKSGSFSRELAARLVDGVIDGKYPEVRAILVYH